MKKILLLFGIIALAFSCVRLEEKEDLSTFLGTRSDAPLEGTVWENVIEGKYNKYIAFNDGEACVFYGLIEDDEIQRWSDIWSAPYEWENGLIKTSITYPFLNNDEDVYQINVVKSDGWRLIIDGEPFNYVGNNMECLECMYMTINVTIAPWIKDE